jgi:hypothetical protein
MYGECRPCAFGSRVAVQLHSDFDMVGPTRAREEQINKQIATIRLLSDPRLRGRNDRDAIVFHDAIGRDLG